MIVLDWRSAPPETVAPVFEQERQRWLEALQWDSTRTWREVERARTTWGLPGLLAVDDRGRALGCLFYLPDNQRFDIGGVTADTAATTGVLLDSVVARALSADVRELRCFVFDNAPNLSCELARCGFHVDPYLYLSTPLAPAGPARALARGDARSAPGLKADSWQPRDVAAVAVLLRDAYPGEAGRIFAPDGTLVEWERYVRNLVEQGACGDLNALASRVVRIGGRVVAAAIVTAVAPRTAHLAQFAVHPGVQGKGMARLLLHQAFDVAAAQGYSTATLLVAEGNTRARALYASVGFQPGARFVAASTTSGQ